MALKSKIVNRFKINFFIMLSMVSGILLAIITGLYFKLPDLAIPLYLSAFLVPFLIIDKLKRRFMYNSEIEFNEDFFKIIVDDINKEENITI